MAAVGRFRGGCIRASVDIQLPQAIDEKEILRAIQAAARGMYNQHRSIISQPSQAPAGQRFHFRRDLAPGL